MIILELWPQVDRMVRYLLRGGYARSVDVKGKPMTGFARPWYKREEDKALKKAFKLVESDGW